MLGETKLNHSHKLSFKDHLIRNDLKNAVFGGGTAMLIKRDIDFEEIKLNANNINNTIETLTVKIKNKNSNNLYISSIYDTNNNKIEVIQELNNILDELQLGASNKKNEKTIQS